jgi:PTS system nitrogen regulatory IIA component
MLDFNNVLLASCTRTVGHQVSKKSALQLATDVFASRFPELDTRLLFHRLMERENLGSTGLGEGVAIPHCRMSGFEQIAGVFLKLANPIEFESPDGAPIDLMFVLVVPDAAEASHLEVLSVLASVLGKAEYRTSLRDIQNDEALHTHMLQLLNASHDARSI